MHLHLVISEQLAESSALADELREQARRLMVDAVADAHQAGMTQREIAAKLGRSQPEVSRLLGLSPPRFRSKTELGMRLIGRRKEVIAAAARFGAENVRVFGSLARGEDDEQSDVDLMVDLPKSGFSLLDHSRLQIEIEKILDRPVDVVASKAMRGKPRENAHREAVVL